MSGPVNHKQNTAFYLCRAIEGLENPSDSEDMEKLRQSSLFGAVESFAKLGPRDLTNVDTYIKFQTLVRQALFHYLRNETPKALECLHQVKNSGILAPFTELRS